MGKSQGANPGNIGTPAEIMETNDEYADDEDM